MQKVWGESAPGVYFPWPMERYSSNWEKAPFRKLSSGFQQLLVFLLETHADTAFAENCPNNSQSVLN